MDQTVNEEKIHPIFINTDEIVEHIMDKDENPSSLSIIAPIPIKGKVFSKNGNPVDMCVVFVNHPPFQTVTTGKDGVFEITPGVTPGKWKIYNTNSGEFVDVEVSSDGKIIPPEPVIRVDAPTEKAIIRGKCLNILTHKGIPQAEIKTDYGSAKTDENGGFEIASEKDIKELGGTDWTAKAEHENFLPDAVKGKNATFSNNIVDIGTIALIPIPQLAGEVISDMGFNVPWFVSFNSDESQAFVTNKNSDFVSIIDTRIDREIVTVDTGKMPLGAVYAGDKLFVANAWSKNISIIDPLQQKAVGVLEDLDSPAYMTTDGEKLYVTLQDNIAGNRIAVLKIENNNLSLDRFILAGKFPHGIAIDKIEGNLYVANYDRDNVSKINIATGESILIPVGPSPQGIAISPSGEYVYTAEEEGISQIDARKGFVVNRFLQSGSRFGWVAVVQLPDNKGDLVYATDTANSKLWIWCPGTKATASVNVGISPFGLAVTKDGLKIYVCCSEANKVQYLEIKD